MFEQLNHDICICASGCGSVCMWSIRCMYVCVERGHDTLTVLGGEKAIVRVYIN